MASPASQAAGQPDEAAKARLKAHMNNEHQEDLSYILQHYTAFSADFTKDAELVDVDLATLTIKSLIGIHMVPIVPPMASWDERRQRLTDMTLEARAALGAPLPDHVDTGGPAPAGQSGIAVTHYEVPEPWAALVGGSVMFYFVTWTAVQLGLVAPGTALGNLVTLVRWPGGPRGFNWFVRTIFLLVLAIHVGEATYFDHTRLARHGVRRGTGVWFLWIVTSFFEGVPAFQQFDRLVKRKEAEAEKKQAKSN